MNNSTHNFPLKDEALHDQLDPSMESTHFRFTNPQLAEKNIKFLLDHSILVYAPLILLPIQNDEH